jgi:hypothetical protein
LFDSAQNKDYHLTNLKINKQQQQINQQQINQNSKGKKKKKLKTMDEIRKQLEQLDSIRDLLQPEEYDTKRAEILNMFGSPSSPCYIEAHDKILEKQQVGADQSIVRMRKERSAVVNQFDRMIKIETICDNTNEDNITNEDQRVISSDLVQITRTGSLVADYEIPVAFASLVIDDDDIDTGEETGEGNEMLKTAKETVKDKKFLYGAGLGFVTGAAVGAGATHIFHKKKNKKNEKKDSNSNNKCGKKKETKETKETKEKKEKKETKNNDSDSDNSLHRTNTKRIQVENKKLLDDDGTVSYYTGSLLKKTNKPDGYGYMDYIDNPVVKSYKGVWSKGEYNNNGCAIFTNGDSYKGEIEINKFHGHGRYEHQDGSVYDGYWKNNEYHGQGRKEYADGGKYKGAHCRNFRDGHGRYEYPDGSAYDGYWKNDKCHGQGKKEYSDGRVYVGSWKNDVSDHGELRWNDGFVYSGDFLDQVPHGVGTLTDTNNGTIHHSGYWILNKFSTRKEYKKYQRQNKIN